MKQLLERFCNDTSITNGLLLIDMPTGAGKTYNAVRYIAEHFEKIKQAGSKIFFITTLKKNLPFNDLLKQFKNIYGDEKGEAIYNREVLKLESNWECIYHNFDKADNELRKIISDKKLLEEIRNNIRIIADYEKSFSAEKTDIDSIAENNQIETYESLARAARDKIRKELEPVLRNEIEEYIKFDEKGVPKTKAAKKRMATNGGELSFIGDLYPSVYTDDKTILIMSLDKFLARNCSIIESSYQFFSNSRLLKNSIIFIDEFDACKETILDHIIENGTRNRLSVFNMFWQIYNGLTSTDCTEQLFKPSKENRKNKDEKGDRWHLPSEIVSKLLAIAKEIYKKYSMHYLFRLKTNSNKKSNFIFHDFKYHYILSGGEGEIEVSPNDDDSVNDIKLKEFNKYNYKKEKISADGKYSLNLLLNEIKSFLIYFQNGVGHIAKNYLQKKRFDEKSIIDYTPEWAVKTVLAEFKIEGKYNQYLIENIMPNFKPHTEKENKGVSRDFDTSVYQKGFRYYSFIDSEEHDTQTKIDYVAFNETPEKLILDIALYSRIIGISATATLRTVTGNFDIEYLKKSLRNKFIEQSEEDIKRLDLDFKKKTNGYDKTQIKPVAITSGDFNDNSDNIDEEDTLDKLFEIFHDKDEANYYYQKLRENADTPFIMKRYLRLIHVMNVFIISENINSMLSLMNIKAAFHKGFNREFIKELFNTLLVKHSTAKCYLRFLDGSPEKFDRYKKSIHASLRKGNRIFILSTYQTVGAGQNLHYEVSEDIISSLRKVNDTDYEDNFKDIEAIYLDKPTNVFSLPKADDPESLANYLFNVSFLRQSGELDLDEIHDYIAKGFRNPQFIKIPDRDSVSRHYARIILQAVGRICRTKNKSEKIYIFYDSGIKEYLAKSRMEFDNKRINPEFACLLEQAERREPVTPDELRLKRQAEDISSVMYRHIMGLLNNPWTLTTRKEWIELRETVLHHPYLLSNNGDAPIFLYVELPQARKGYFYIEEDDFANTKISFTEDSGGMDIVSENTSGLIQLMKIDEIRELFLERNFATCFQKASFIIPPVIFNNIYKGALGEVAGRYVVEKYVINTFDIKQLSEIDSIDNFEKFDFVYKGRIFFDFKNWLTEEFVSKEIQADKIIDKLNACGGENAVIINCLPPRDKERFDYQTLLGNKILIIPWLFDTVKGTVDSRMIDRIREFII